MVRKPATSSREVDFAVSADSTIPGHLEAAKQLGKENRSTLGLFPDGAFDEHARKSWIIYLLADGKVCGYLLYRLAKGRAVIVHLCIGDEFRGSGGAQVLFSALRDIIDDGVCRGIEVRCRRDYAVTTLWPKLGFVFVKYVPGRGKGTSELGVWFFRFDTTEFFQEMLPKQDDDDLVWAVLDANIVFKVNKPDIEECREASALLSESLTPYTRFFVTQEIFTEIARNQDTQKASESTVVARSFEILEPTRAQLDDFGKQLTALWGTPSKERDRSDYSHILHTIASGNDIFITQDQGILERAETLYENFGLKVVRPVEFIVELDQLENSERYSPRSLARTEFNELCPSHHDLEMLADAFHRAHTGEKRKRFIARLRSAIANPDKYKTVAVQSPDADPKLLIIFRHEPQRLVIETFRHDGSPAAKTLGKNLVSAESRSAIESGIRIIQLDDEFNGQAAKDLFNDFGTLSTQNGWIRLSATITKPYQEAVRLLGEFLNSPAGSISTDVFKMLHSAISIPKTSSEKLEEAFAPLKIEDSDVPSYLIPIKPVWAMHLFDTHLAKQELWGADPLRHFNIENVYYRSTKPFNFQPGARILWYVSQDKGNRVSEIRACSRLISSETASAKDLFSKYKRLGIYGWSDLMRITNHDPYGRIMAVRFYQTETFSSPIKLSDFDEFGVNGAPMGPRAISPAQFISLYKSGMNIHE